MSIFNLRPALAFLIALGSLLFSVHSLLAEESAPGNLKSTIAHLGLERDKPYWGFDTLALSRAQSVKLLVDQLEPVTPGWYSPAKKTRQSKHFVASLRALHFLTGKTFSASTKTKLNEDQKQFLDFDQEMHDNNPSHALHCFSVWMSRDADIIAPLDVQKDAIEQWKKYAEQSDAEYQPAVPAAKSMQSWYWFG